MSSLRRLGPADYRVMPWKNGLGTTTELTVHPPGSSLDAFTFRISIADLRASGPFSTFAGYDRVLVQIEGAPMTLSHEGREERRLTLLSPYRFAGELDTYGALETPPARDFNVMVRRDRASAEVTVHELASGASARAEAYAEAWIVYVLRGRVSVEVSVEPSVSVTLAADETLIATGAGWMNVTAAAEGIVAIVTSIGPPGEVRTPRAPTG